MAAVLVVVVSGELVAGFLVTKVTLVVGSVGHEFGGGVVLWELGWYKSSGCIAATGK